MLRNHFEEVNVCLANTKGTLRRVFYEKCGGGGGSRFSVLSRYIARPTLFAEHMALS